MISKEDDLKEDTGKWFEINDFATYPDGLLGTGGYGKVCLCKHKQLGLVAVKLFQLTGAEDKEAKKKMLLREGKFMIDDNHPNVIEVFGFFQTSNISGIVMEYAPCKNLESLIIHRKEVVVSLQLCIRFMKEIIAGLVYFHCREKPIVHRDLKLQNILLSDGLKVKIADFGVSTFVENVSKTTGSESPKICGTVPYIAPERYNRNYHQPSPKEDIFSFALISYEILFRESCVSNSTPDVVKAYYGRGQRPDLKDLTSSANNEENKNLNEMIKACWHKEPEERWSAVKVQEYLQSQWNTDTHEVDDKAKTLQTETNLRHSTFDDEAQISLNSFINKSFTSEGLTSSNALIIVGGLATKSDAVKVFLPSKELESLPKLQEGRSCHCSVLVENKLYVIGGTSKGQVLSSVECLDVKDAKEGWSFVGSMNEKRFLAAAQLFQKKIYVLGGKNEANAALDTIELYNSLDDQWTNCENKLSTKRYSFNSFILKDQICCCAGLDGDDKPISEMELISLGTTDDSSLKPQALKESRSSSCVVKSGNYSYLLIGGMDESKKPLRSVMKYSTKSIAWTEEKPKMQWSRCSFTAGIIGTCVYVVGGHGVNEKRSSLSTIEMIDLSAKDPKWDIVKRLEKSWAGHSMVVQTL